MAPETYYLCFSLIAVYSFILHMTNMIHFRITNKTLAGRSYKRDTVEYAKLQKYSRGKGLPIAIIIGLLCISNLTYDIYRVLHLGKPDYAHFALTFFPIAFAVAFIVMAIQSPKAFSDKKK